MSSAIEERELLAFPSYGDPEETKAFGVLATHQLDERIGRVLLRVTRLPLHAASVAIQSQRRLTYGGNCSDVTTVMPHSLAIDGDNAIAALTLRYVIYAEDSDLAGDPFGATSWDSQHCTAKVANGCPLNRYLAAQTATSYATKHALWEVGDTMPIAEAQQSQING